MPRHKRALLCAVFVIAAAPAAGHAQVQVSDATMPGSADPALVREVVRRGFQVSGSGRMSLGSRERMQLGTGTPPTRLPESASFVTFTRRLRAGSRT